jgi:hypothetical protein
VELEGVALGRRTLFKEKNPHEGESSSSATIVELEGVALGRRTLFKEKNPHEGESSSAQR